MNPISSSGRRSFLKTVLAAGVAPMILPSGLLGKDAPSNKTTLGFIGVVWQGVDLNLKSFLTEDDCRCVVVCEKPTYTIAEGRVLVDAVKKSGKVFSTGLEDRSLIHYHRMVEWVRNGAIGDLHHMDVGVPEGAIHPWEEEEAVPEDLNWKLWLGPAPYHPYTATRTEPMHWRYIRDYSTGIVTDWGCHLVDTAQFAANDPHQCAIEVKGSAVAVPEKAQSNIPANYDLHYRYSNGVTMQLHNVSKDEGLGKNVYVRFYGSKGWVSVTGWRGQFDASDPKVLRKKYAPEKSIHFPLPVREHPNFLACIRSGEEPTYPPETLHQLSTTLHMGVIAADLGRGMSWDPKKERFIDDEEANSKLAVEIQNDWKSA